MGVYLTMNVLQYQAEWKNINAPACRVLYSYVNIIFLIKIYKPIKLLTLLQHIKYEQTPMPACCSNYYVYHVQRAAAVSLPRLVILS